MMFKIAYLIGIYSYTIFSLGLLSVLYKEVILGVTLIYATYALWSGFIASARSQNSLFKSRIFSFAKSRPAPILTQYFRKITRWPQVAFQSGIRPLLLVLISSQALVNLVGALGPELGFDALWYHLTLPKIYLENHSVFHIQGSLFYYSDMPKLTEMVFLGFLANDTFSKLTHFGFGILTLIALYKLSRIFLDEKFSLLTVLVFYSNLVVGWQSITAYVDLARTFFELTSLWGFINWWKNKKEIWLVESGLMLGLAVATKLVSLGSMLIFIFLIVYALWRLKRIKKLLRTIVLFIGSTLLIPLPYFTFAFLNTRNPVYPVFSEFYRAGINLQIVNPFKLADPISPIYFIFLPFIIFFFKKFNDTPKLIALYSGVSFVIWYLTPQTGGGRFIMPYLPAYSLLTVLAIKMFSKYNVIRTTSLFLVIFIAAISILYRGAANSKYIPVILGLQSKGQFLTNNLNFSYGDFYDTDGYFRTHLKEGDKVLLYGFHNLYYVNFPFIDSSYVQSGDEFNYIATQNTKLPERFKFWNLVYSNSRSGVNLYSAGGIKWMY